MRTAMARKKTQYDFDVDFEVDFNPNPSTCDTSTNDIGVGSSDIDFYIDNLATPPPEVHPTSL